LVFLFKRKTNTWKRPSAFFWKKESLAKKTNIGRSLLPQKMLHAPRDDFLKNS